MALEITRAEIEGTVGIVHVESDDMQELLTAKARTMAYDERVKMGLAGAGIEQLEVMPLDDQGKEVEDTAPEKAPVRWRRVFRLTPSPI